MSTKCTGDRDIVHVSTVHPSGDNRIVFKECLSLARAGYRVSYVGTSDGPQKLPEALRYSALSKPKTRTQRLFRTQLNALIAVLRMKPALVHFHDPELIPLALCARLAGIKTVFDIHENLPLQVRSKPWIPSALRPLASLVAKIIDTIGFRFCNGVVLANQREVPNWAARKCAFVLNYPRLEDWLSISIKPASNKELRLFYCGGISSDRGILKMLDSLVIVNKTTSVRLVLVGRFSTLECESASRDHEGWKYVDYHGFATADELPTIASTTHIGIAVLAETPQYKQIVPTKLFEYMAAGMPFIASDFPSWRAAVGTSDAGLWVNPRDARQLAEAILRLSDDQSLRDSLGAVGRHTAEFGRSWKSQEVNLLDLYQRLLAPRKASTSA
ncbi:MAG: glycosyltransferase [Proteobacteria bacterium]|nr:glycosyltransferase [Pseudomonadota bacterium]